MKRFRKQSCPGRKSPRLPLHAGPKSPQVRSLFVEALEDRRLLASLPASHLFNSRAGATHTLFLDFDGAAAFTWTNTDGVAIAASGPAPGDADDIPEFDMDGNPSTFTADELDAIEDIFNYVAEKYSPFDVNVTTVDPLSYNDFVAARVIVGGRNCDWDNSPGTTGRASRGGFTLATRDNTSFVWSKDIIGASISDVELTEVGETIAHEAGHTFGLWHQSAVLPGAMIGDPVTDEYFDGDATTAPIMGDSDAFPEKRGVWWLGPKSDGPTFQGQQDDLAVLQGVLGVAEDDYGSSTSTGLLDFNPQTGGVRAGGIIETNGDQDGFRFTAVSPSSYFTVNTPVGGMLAPTLELVRVGAGGSPSVSLLTTNTSALLNATNLVPGGEYILRVSPQGGAYGSLGQYTIVGNLHAGLSLVVDSNADEFDLDVTAGHLSLREAVGLANVMAGADVITFAPALSGQTITLGGTELAISESLTIDATPLAANVTVNANHLSRIFNMTATTGNFTLGGLNLTNGKTTASVNIGAGRGAAIRAMTNGHLTLTRTTVTGNSAGGDFAAGGAIFAASDVTLNQSTISGNSTTGGFADGGGIKAEAVTLNQTTVSENTTAGPFSRGGGIAAAMVTLNQSIVRGNSTAGTDAKGGGIYANGSVTLNESAVSGNSTAGSGDGAGGGIYASGDVMLTDSTVRGNSTVGVHASGGGIAAASLTLVRSTVSANRTSGESADGGGIAAGGDVTLSHSTVSGNSTTGSDADGGGIWTFDADITLTQSTVSDNNATGERAVGGGLATFGNVTLTQSTVSGNNAMGLGGGVLAGGALAITQSTVTNNHAAGMGGGAVHSSVGTGGPMTVSGSILAGNTAGGVGSDLFDDSGSTLTVNYSLIGTGIVPSAGAGNVTTNNPQLAPLANNGGPTKTHAPLTGSPVIDAGDPAIAVDPAQFDQRGAPFQRVVNGDGLGSARIDIGAHELQAVTGLSLIVDSVADVYDGDFSAGHLSLREAVNLANGMPGANTITFAPAMSGAVINLTGTEIEIAEPLTIDARPLPVNVTVNARQLSRLLNITPVSGDFTLGGLTLVGGRTTADGQAGDGGAIHSFSTGHLTLDRLTVTGSSTLGDFAKGGAIFAGGDLSLLFSTANGNSTAGDNALGGAIYAAGDVTLTHTIVSQNKTLGANAAGGGIFAVGDATLVWGAIDGNSTAGANAAGGGIVAAGDVSLTYSSVTGNSTAGFDADGGGIAANGAISFNASSVTGNSATGLAADGGGIYSFYGAVTLGRSTISDNSAKGGGGGISAQAGVTAADSTISGNRAFDSSGGGIRSFGPVALTRSTLSGNSAAGLSNDGGGIWTDDALTFIQSTVTLNTANGIGGVGGGVMQAGTDANHPIVISGSIIAGNNAFLGDDLIKDAQSTLTVNYSLIGTAITPTTGVGNVTTDNPQLAPLANNGGLTPNVVPTHALLPGSWAIDAGDPAIAFNPAEFDQRGAPYVRVVDGDENGVARIDIGAFEKQANISANFDGDADVDGVDFLAWQRGFGASGPAATLANGNADFDNDVDAVDLAHWKASFGNFAAEPAVATLMAHDSPWSLFPQAVDAAIAWQMADEGPSSRPLFRPRALRRGEPSHQGPMRYLRIMK